MDFEARTNLTAEVRRAEIRATALFASAAWAAIVLVSAWAGAQAPATQPTTAPAARESVRRWVIQLSDESPAVRDVAKYELMGLRRSDLPTLRKAVEEFRPIDASTRQELREIVTHVYLTEYRYEKDPFGFLGIKMPRVPGDDAAVVESRLPGFCAYRSLHNGDVILDIEEKPFASPLDREEFTGVIRQIRPGMLVHLKVLRQGKVIRVPIRLDARPADRSNNNPMEYENTVEGLFQDREKQARDYWQANFAPITADPPRQS